MEKAKKTGRYPWGTDEEVKLRMIQRRDAGIPVADIAKDLGLEKADVRELIDEYEDEVNRLTLDYESKKN